MRDDLSVIRITTKRKLKIKKLAIEMGLKEITILEYLLSGKINLRKVEIE